MKTNLRDAFFTVITISLLGLFVIGCDSYQAVTFENKTTVPVKGLNTGFHKNITEIQQVAGTIERRGMMSSL